MKSTSARHFFALVFLLATATLPAVHAAAGNPDIGFNDYLIGKLKSDFKFRGCVNGVEGRKDFEICAPPKMETSIAGLAAQIQTIIFKDGKLIGIEIDLKTTEAGMSTVNASLTEKFSAPLATNSSDANHPTLVRWVMGENQINSETYSDGISAVIFFNNVLMKEFNDAQREAQLKKQGGK